MALYLDIMSSWYVYYYMQKDFILASIIIRKI